MVIRWSEQAKANHPSSLSSPLIFIYLIVVRACFSSLERAMLCRIRNLTERGERDIRRQGAEERAARLSARRFAPEQLPAAARSKPLTISGALSW